MSHNVDMFDGTIGHQQAIFMFKILSILRRALDGLFHEGRVFRMNPLEKKFHSRFRSSAGGLPPARSSGQRKPFESSNTTEQRNRLWNFFSNGFIRKTRPS